MYEEIFKIFFIIMLHLFYSMFIHVYIIYSIYYNFLHTLS